MVVLNANSEYLTFATWNATGITSSAQYPCDLLTSREIDICGISEHWLYRENLIFMNNINKDYLTFSQSDPDLDICSNRNVGKGGLCFLWKKRN